MQDLIEALAIFAKYTDVEPTHCEHDTLYVNVNPDDVTDEDKKRLDELGFFAKDYMFCSFRFGSY